MGGESTMITMEIDTSPVSFRACIRDDANQLAWQKNFYIYRGGMSLYDCCVWAVEQAYKRQVSEIIVFTSSTGQHAYEMIKDKLRSNRIDITVKAYKDMLLK